MGETKKYEEKIRKLIPKVMKSMPRLQYHNFSHAMDVYETVKKLSEGNGINDEEKFLLKTAALLHDVVYIPGNHDNEEESADKAKIYLQEIGYSRKQIMKVKELILATKIPTNPQNYLEELICDSDLGNLGRKDFFESGEKFRKESDIPENKDWYIRQLGFIEHHEYYTGVAKSLFNQGKINNIQKLRGILRKLNE